MVNDGFAWIHPLRAHILLARAARVAPPEPLGRTALWPKTAESPCDCESDSYDCADFATHEEAQDCFDYCGALRGFDVHGLDGDWVVCEGLE